MKRFAMGFVVGLVLLSSVGATRASAQSAAPANEELNTVRNMSLDKLSTIGKRVLMFAQEIPAEKYTWNPGVMLVPAPPDPQADPYGRTVADLFLHIANLNFTRPVQMGAAPPQGFDPKDKNYETSTTDKAKVIEQLTKSFAYARDALQFMRPADLRKTIPLTGPGSSSGSVVLETDGVAVLIGWMNDLSEYEGQTIAYGRLNGVIGTGEKFVLRKPGQ